MMDSIAVRVFKYDGSPYRQWEARLASKDGPLLILDAEFDADVTHESLGVISKGTRTVEYYWLDRWYSIFQFLDNRNVTSFYYCNINTPPAFTAGVLSYVDLDLDVLVRPDKSYELLDLDEFEQNAARFNYSEETKQGARGAVDELVEMIERGLFPFSLLQR